MIMLARFFTYQIVLYGLSIQAVAQDQTHRGERVIRYQCGACHIKSLPTANEEALKVFNLENRIWARTLTESIREKIEFNIESRINLSDKEISYLMPKNYKPLPKRPNKKDLTAVKIFLEREKNKKGSFLDIISN